MQKNILIISPIGYITKYMKKNQFLGVVKMVTEQKRVRFKAIVKNPLADKLKAKKSKSILRVGSKRNSRNSFSSMCNSI